VRQLALQLLEGGGARPDALRELLFQRARLRFCPERLLETRFAHPN
jgi:hypothetical protein